MLSHNQQGKSNVFVIIIAALLVLLLVFALSKIIPRPAKLAGNIIPTATPTPGTSPAPNTNTYSNSDYNFSIALPEGWKAREHDKVFEFGPGDDTRLTITVADQSAQATLTNFRSDIQAEKNTRISLEREVRIGSRYVKQITVTDTTTDSDTYYRFVDQGDLTLSLSSPDSSLLDLPVFH